MTRRIALVLLVLVLAACVGVSGASVMTFYPVTGTSGDGSLARTIANDAFLDLVTGAGTGFGYATTTNAIYIKSDTDTDKFASNVRCGLQFDTSSLPDDATITSAVVGVNPSTFYSTLNATGINIVNATKSSGAWSESDYSNFGNTVFSDYISTASMTAGVYENFTLNTYGISNISTTGSSSFMLKTALDINQTAPTWVSGGSKYAGMTIKSSENGVGIPYLEVTYNEPIRASISPSGIQNVWEPEGVQFDDISLGSPVSWSWAFGDGETSIVQTPPLHNWTFPGIYNVSLTVSNVTGSFSTNYTDVHVHSSSTPRLTVVNSSLIYTKEGTPYALYTMGGLRWNISNETSTSDPIFKFLQVYKDSDIIDITLNKIASVNLSFGYAGGIYTNPSGNYTIIGNITPSGYGPGTAYFFPDLASVIAGTPATSLGSVYQPHNNGGSATVVTDRSFPDNSYMFWVDYAVSESQGGPKYQYIYRVNEIGTFERVLNVSSQAGGIRHFHSLSQDPYIPSSLYATSGDGDSAVRAWKSEDYGDTWVQVASGSQMYRALNIVFDENYMYWGTDGQIDGHTMLIRANKDMGDPEILYNFPDIDLVNYGIIYSNNPHGLIIPTITWVLSGIQNSIPIYFYSLDYGTMTQIYNSSVSSSGGYDYVPPYIASDGKIYIRFVNGADYALVALRVSPPSDIILSQFTPPGPISLQYPNGQYFQDNSTGSPTSWDWNWGDGTHCYTQDCYKQWYGPGVYHVSLNASTTTSYSLNSTVVQVMGLW